MKPKRLATRREFLHRGLGLVSATATVPLWLGSTAHAGEGGTAKVDDPVLVVLELNGGNDVLSSIVPYTRDEYYRLRPTTGIRPNDTIKLNDHLGLNPNLRAVEELYKDGDMAIVQGVGYPNPSRSHFNSMDIFHTCNHKSPQRGTGWLATYVEKAKRKAGTLTGISIGPDTPKALIGSKYRAVQIQDPESFGLQIAEEGGSVAKAARALNRPRKSKDPNLEFLATLAMQTDASSEAVRKAVSRFEPSDGYDDDIGESLATVAALICGGLKTRLFFVRQQGYDTHSGQRWRHDYLMGSLARSLRTFMRDIARHGHQKRVIVMAFSEFGRRVKENASEGTDHGAAGAMFLFGKPVKGGIFGKHPSLTDLDDGDLKWSTDFRSVYASVIEGWLGGSAKQVLGRDYPKLKLV